MNKDEFNKLSQQLFNQFDELWQETQKTAMLGWEEVVCDKISPLIERTIKSISPEVNTAIYYGNFNKVTHNVWHVFNIVIVDDKKVIIDGSFRQFDENSERLRIFWPEDEMYSRYSIVGKWRM